MTIIEKHIDKIDKLCLAHHVSQLYAFGSVLNNSFNEKSDVDFIVNFEPIIPEQYADNYYELKFSLEDVLQKPVDLLEEKAIRNPYFKQVVNHQRRLIYER